jgi:hypothetical protein
MTTPDLILRLRHLATAALAQHRDTLAWTCQEAADRLDELHRTVSSVQARGRLGGLTRAHNLSAERRRQIAYLASHAARQKKFTPPPCKQG